MRRLEVVPRQEHLGGAEISLAGSVGWQPTAATTMTTTTRGVPARATGECQCRMVFRCRGRQGIERARGIWWRMPFGMGMQKHRLLLLLLLLLLFLFLRTSSCSRIYFFSPLHPFIIFCKPVLVFGYTCASPSFFMLGYPYSHFMRCKCAHTPWVMGKHHTLCFACHASSDPSDHRVRRCLFDPIFEHCNPSRTVLDRSLHLELQRKTSQPSPSPSPISHFSGLFCCSLSLITLDRHGTGTYRTSQSMDGSTITFAPFCSAALW